MLRHDAGLYPPGVEPRDWGPDDVDERHHDPHASADLQGDVAKIFRAITKFEAIIRKRVVAFFLSGAGVITNSELMTPLRVAIVGFGTVGRSVARILIHGVSGLRLTRVFNRNVNRKRVDWVPASVSWTETIDDVFSPDVDVVVELVGGTDPAFEWMRRALSKGKSVVTANKQVMARHGLELFELARANGAQLGFEASVAGGIPVIRGIQEGLGGDELIRVQGVLNGTCNYILSEMASSVVSFETVLADAQARGYAEADPAVDLDGFDAQAKLAILSAVGLRRRVEPTTIPCRSIRGLVTADFDAARELGRAIRQVSVAERVKNGSGVRAAVGPAMVRLDSRLAQVAGSENVVVVDGVRGGQTAFVGQGAGGDPTAVAVVSDLLAIASGNSRMITHAFPVVGSDHRVVEMGAQPHYLRAAGGDEAERRLTEFGVVGAQRLDAVDNELSMVTDPCTTEAIEKSMNKLTNDEAVRVLAALPLVD